MIHVKLCKNCGKEKPIDQFRPKGITTAGKPKYGHCGLCESIYEHNRRRKRGQSISVRKEEVKALIRIESHSIEYATMKRIANRPKYQIKNHDKQCKECNGFFKGYTKSVFCKPSCYKAYSIRVNRLKRKALQRKVTVECVDPYIVFERFEWHCTYCGTYTPPQHRGLHLDDSPELDHIIPLSKGGSHSYINTTLACRKCNTLKHDKVLDLENLFYKGVGWD